MAGDGRKPSEPTQGDLFARADALFPVRERRDAIAPLDTSLKIKTALGVALKKHPESAAVIAAKMSEILGRPISTDALYSYTGQSKSDHDIGIVRLKAFIRVTGAAWLWDLIVEDEGLVVLAGREAHLAQLGQLEQEKERLNEEIRSLRRNLRARPVDLAKRMRGRR